MRTEIPEGWHRAAESLKSDITLAASRGEDSHNSTVNFSVPTHTVITLALRDLVMSPEHRGRTVGIRYRDLSRPRPFPLGGLRPEFRGSRLEGMAPLVIGLLSHRHPEMDYLIDVYMNTNREMSSAISMAEEDELSYHNAQYWFSGVNILQPLVAYVLHAGLEPMVVGFYRALAEVLAPGKPQCGNLLITPCVLRPDLPRDLSTSRITGQTPGAKLDDYIALPSWY